MTFYSIGKQFSEEPAGRYYSDGKGSGEEFREEVLVPLIRKLKSGDILEIRLDEGVESYGSSFLSESFGGLVAHGYFHSEELLSKLKFSYEDEDFEFYENRIFQYIKESSFDSKTYVSSKQNTRK
ncbi:STAS-like domain-containing protein [Simiduia curdlanivorans]|uniref:STAS-like domain-containing protein n=1 Tax=Simiduia curdlanivorans TaxID=1492769 RepID=A0ABV8VA19_9GAMM|nr:STAS-like domain-containing protein [Simiduia curdlanivorans]MDN3639634.1 STAS-like domain-containing protein [Simiduia curdlanivorans]